MESRYEKKHYLLMLMGALSIRCERPLDAEEVGRVADAYVELTLPMIIRYCCAELTEIEHVKSLPAEDAKKHVARYTKALEIAWNLLLRVRDHRLPSEIARDAELLAISNNHPSWSNQKIANDYNRRHDKNLTRDAVKQAIIRYRERMAKLQARNSKLYAGHVQFKECDIADVISALPLPEQIVNMLNE